MLESRISDQETREVVIEEVVVGDDLGDAPHVQVAFFKPVEYFDDRVHFQEAQRADHADNQPGSVDFEMVEYRGYGEASRHSEADLQFLGSNAHVQLLMVVFELPLLLRQAYIGDLVQLAQSIELGPQEADVNHVEEHSEDFEREQHTLEAHSKAKAKRYEDDIVK